METRLSQLLFFSQTSMTATPTHVLMAIVSITSMTSPVFAMLDTQDSSAIQASWL